MAGGTFNPFDGRDELISSLGKRPNITWRRRIVIECQTNLSNAEIQPTIEIDEGVDAPDCSAQFLAGHRLAGLEDKAREHLGGLRLQADENALTSKFSSGKVEFKKAESKSF